MIQRRTLLQLAAKLSTSLPFVRFRISAADSVFSDEERRRLLQIARLVLPSVLGEVGQGEVVTAFEHYVRDYQPGADTEHGYGKTHVISKGPTPLPVYTAQLASFNNPLATSDLQSYLAGSNIKDLPRIPSGTNVVVDLMAFYFRSSQANDLCYQAAIGRDDCRGLAGSNQRPHPLQKVSYADSGE